MEKIKFIYADLQKTGDKENSILLTTIGTKKDLEKHEVKFEEGETYWFWRDNEIDNPLVFPAKVRFNKDLNAWIADYDPNSIKEFLDSEFANQYSPKDIENG